MKAENCQVIFQAQIMAIVGGNAYLGVFPAMEGKRGRFKQVAHFATDVRKRRCAVWACLKLNLIDDAGERTEVLRDARRL